MGGNISLQGSDNITYTASRIPFDDKVLVSLRYSLNSIFKLLNAEYKKRYNARLWDRNSYSKYLNGSSSYILGKDYDIDLIASLKNDIGDIDIMVDKNKSENLYYFLKYIEGNKFSIYDPGKVSITLNAINANDKDKLGNTIITIFNVEIGSYKFSIQIDFELADFKNGIPTEWSYFSHNSHIDDVKIGIKAVNHKYLLRALVGVASTRDDIILCTPSSTITNIKLKKTNLASFRMYQFGVDSGIGQAYQAVSIDSDPIKIDNKFLYRERKPEEKVYVKNVNYLLYIIFNKKTPIESLYSFKSLAKETSSFNKVKKIKILERFISILFGSNGNQVQKIDPLNKDNDKKLKLDAYQYLADSYGLSEHFDLTDIIKSYQDRAFK